MNGLARYRLDTTDHASRFLSRAKVSVSSIQGRLLSKETRIQDYENYLSLEDIDEINHDTDQPDPSSLQEVRILHTPSPLAHSTAFFPSHIQAAHMNSEEYYTFKYAKLTERCSIGHFQLRNLLWATTKDDIYYMCKPSIFNGLQRLTFSSSDGDTVRQWSPQLCSSRQIMDVSTANSPQSLIIKISSMACGQNILMVGGFMGEYAFRRLDDMNAPVHYGVTTDHANGIANHIHISEGRKGGKEKNIKKRCFLGDGTQPVDRYQSRGLEQ